MITKIRFQDGKIEHIDISKMEFIPNGMFREFEKLIARKDEEAVNILCDCSYHIQKKYVSKEQTEEFKYPIVYTVPKSGIPNLRYSSTNEKGHFGIHKIIWSNGAASTPVIDEKGEFGITEFAYAIIDKPKNLPFIKKAMENPDFCKLMKYAEGTSSNHRYNHKAISLFRKYFWKDFI